MSSMMPDVKEVLITSDQIEAKVREIGARITEDYSGERPLLIGILRGAVVIMSDLMRNIDLRCELDFMDRHVLIVEDIIDTGLTLSYLMRSLYARKPASLEICALLSKPSRRRADLDVKYLGFEVPDEFVVGYGLDYAGSYRNLPDICVLKPEIFE